MTVAGRVAARAVRLSRSAPRRRAGIPGFLRHFFRTPKGQLLVILVALLAVAARVEGPRSVGLVLEAAGAAGVLDFVLCRWRRRRWMFPDGAFLTGLLVAAVLDPREPWFVGVSAAAIGIASKQLVRPGAANAFNPAAIGLVAVFYLFDSAHSWWGALTSIHPASVWPLLLGTGIFIVVRVRRGPLVVAFLATYFALFAGATFAVDPADVAEVFVPPDLYALLFFAFFMLTDPPTSPSAVRQQMLQGALVAGASVAIFLFAGAAHYLLSGVLVGNLLEAGRRAATRVRRPLRG